MCFIEPKKFDLNNTDNSNNVKSNIMKIQLIKELEQTLGFKNSLKIDYDTDKARFDEPVNLDDPENKNNISTFFRTQKKLTKNVGLRQNVNFGHFTFNVPLTIGILAAFFPFIRKRRVYIEVAVLVITIHILYVFFLEGLKLSEALLRSGYEKPNEAKLVFWQFSEGFLKSMVLRFEPFLIGAYLYFSRTRGLEKQVEEVEEIDEMEED